METFKILVLGYHKSGKTTLMENLNAQATETPNKYNVDFDTNGNGQIRFICSESLDNATTRTWNFDGFVIMCDLTKMYSYYEMKRICKELMRLVDSRPIILVGNKKDYTRKREVNSMTADKELPKLPRFEISARDKLDIHKPFLTLARLLTKLPTLTFLEDIDDPNPGPVDDPILEGENDVAVVQASNADNAANADEVVVPDQEVMQSPNASDKAVNTGNPDDSQVNPPAKSYSSISKTIRLDDDLDKFLKYQNPSRCFY
ncbi:hypothetical protein MKW92_010607 [Papaver armeniacum]|nr:hypothetical protein MKW92_010607 [Papaver armeniacum]